MMYKHTFSFPVFLPAIMLVIALLAGCAPAAAPVTTATPSPAPPTVAPTETPLPGSLLPVRGLYVQFERRGFNDGYWSGQVLQLFHTYDDLVGHTVAEEVALQLDEMVKLGVNTISYELRSSTPNSAGSSFVPPLCALPPVLGVQYPQPTELELKNLVEFFDLVHSKGISIQLRLVNTHMEEQPPTKNEQWIGSILNAIKDHPALDLVLFEGSPFMIDTNGDGVGDKCGGPAEGPLWDGPGSVPARYDEWAIQYGHSLGLPYRKLSAEAIVGDYYSFKQGPGGPEMTDSHQWDPVFTLKSIFDNLNVPDDQRTYALSWYEHPKCMTARQIPCQEIGPHAWAIETAQHVYDVIGRGNGARVVVPEMGLYASVPEWNWTTEQALESLVWIMHTYNIDGGCFWRWTDNDNGEEQDPQLAIPIKKRGADFAYNPMAGVLKQLYTSRLRRQTRPSTRLSRRRRPLSQPPLLRRLPTTHSMAPRWISPSGCPTFPPAPPSPRMEASRSRPMARRQRPAHRLPRGGSSPATSTSRWTGSSAITGLRPSKTMWTRPSSRWAWVTRSVYWITRLGLPGDAGQFMAFNEGTGQIGQPVSTKARAGKFRITRSGATLTLFYDVGKGWQQLQSVTVPTGPAQIRMGMSSVNASLAFTTHFEDFRVNSGSVRLRAVARQGGRLPPPWREVLETCRTQARGVSTVWPHG